MCGIQKKLKMLPTAFLFSQSSGNIPKWLKVTETASAAYNAALALLMMSLAKKIKIQPVREVINTIEIQHV